MLARRSLLKIVFFLAICGSTARAQEKTPTRDDLQKVYVDCLKKEGFSPQINERGAIEFKYEGGMYLLAFDEKDPTFLVVMYPNFWRLDSEAERQKALAAANAASSDAKVSKVLVGDKAVFTTYEMRLKDPADYAVFYKRSLSAIQYAVREFATEMKKK